MKPDNRPSWYIATMMMLIGIMIGFFISMAVFKFVFIPGGI